MIVTAHAGPVTLTGQDRQNEYLHRDQDLFEKAYGYIKQYY